MALALLDTNVLVHAAFKQSLWHRQAAQLVQQGLDRSGLYCVSPQNLIEFAAVTSRPRFVESPLPSSELARIGDLLYRSRRLSKIYPRRGTVQRALKEGAAIGVTGPRWYDLYLAMTMRDAGVKIIITENRADFEKFPFLLVKGLDEGVAA